MKERSMKSMRERKHGAGVFEGRALTNRNDLGPLVTVRSSGLVASGPLTPSLSKRGAS
jgi:hypothetical protein